MPPLHLAVPLALALGAATAAAQSPPPAPITTAELTARLSHTLDSLTAAGAFSGVVAIGQNGVTVFARAYGQANRELKRANDVETAFNIGSINKIFTQIAIQQLANDGKLAIDSTLARAWPDYPNADVARRVTIRQMLRHQSGIAGDVFAAPAGGTRRDLRRLSDFLPLFVDQALAFEPGSQNQYSNAGYIVLGLLVERLSGEDYDTYVRRHIYEPAGMARTGAFAVDSLPPNTAVGYTLANADRSPGQTPHANGDLLPGRGSSAGGGYSTAADLLRFVQALRDRRIAGGPPPGVGIAGGTAGVNAVVEGGLPGGYDLVVLANLDPPAAEQVTRMVRGWLGVAEPRGPQGPRVLRP